MGLPDAEDNIFGLSWLEQGPDKTNCNFIIILVKIYMGKMVRYVENKLQNFMNGCIQGVVLVTHAVCSIIKPWHPWTRGLHFNGNSSRGKLSCKTVPWNKALGLLVGVLQIQLCKVVWWKQKVYVSSRFSTTTASICLTQISLSLSN